MITSVTVKVEIPFELFEQIQQTAVECEEGIDETIVDVLEYHFVDDTIEVERG